MRVSVVLPIIVLLGLLQLALSEQLSFCEGDSKWCFYGPTFKDRLRKFYEIHYPKKVKKVDQLSATYSDHEDVVFDELRAKYIRKMLVHKYPDVPLAQPFPRLTLEQLMDGSPETLPYKLGRRPFILYNATDNWPALQKWIGADYLADLFPRAVVDFYPYNMLRSGTHPYLYRFKSAIQQLKKTAPDKFADDHTKEFYPGRYVHLQLTNDQFKMLRGRGDIEPLPRYFNTDNWWMRRCMQSKVLKDEYHIKTHWQIILIGSRGAGMFNHSDTLQTSSWHTHIEGKKWWIVCGTNEGPGPREGRWECFEDVFVPGDTLYYPKKWHHQTQNLVTPTTTITGTSVTPHNWASIANKLWGECARSDLSFNLSGELCDALDKCYEVWQRRYTGRQDTPPQFPPWRKHSTPENIKKKDAIKATENNYDGRNFIGE